MNIEEATDAILAVFRTVWSTRPAVYTDVPGEPPVTDRVWARATVKHATGRAASLTGALGTTIYENRGTAWMQVFAPAGDGGLAASRAATELLNAYRDARTAVRYRNVRLNEVGTDGAFTRYDVKADFEYEDVR